MAQSTMSVVDVFSHLSRTSNGVPSSTLKPLYIEVVAQTWDLQVQAVLKP